MTIHCRLVRPSLRGALVLFVLMPASALALTEFQKLTASDPAPNDNFSYSVGISGNTAILGAWNDDRPGIPADNSGSAYIFREGGAGSGQEPADSVVGAAHEDEQADDQECTGRHQLGGGSGDRCSTDPSSP